MSKTGPFLHVTFCDDARVENTGKFLLIGVYRGELIVPRLPALLPKLMLVCSYVYPLAASEWAPRRLQVMVGTEEVFAADMPTPPDEADALGRDTQGIVAQFDVALAPVALSGPHTIEARMHSAAGVIASPGLRVRQMTEPELARLLPEPAS